MSELSKGSCLIRLIFFTNSLMKLRLGLLNKDLANQFGIALSSRFFTTWIKIISKPLGGALTARLTQEAIKAGNNKCQIILVSAKYFQRN